MEFMCGTVDICVYGFGAKINMARGTDVINLEAVKRSKRALNVYFREFSRPVFRNGAPESTRRSLEFDYEMQFESRDSSRRNPMIFILTFALSLEFHLAANVQNNISRVPLLARIFRRIILKIPHKISVVHIHSYAYPVFIY